LRCSLSREARSRSSCDRVGARPDGTSTPGGFSLEGLANARGPARSDGVIASARAVRRVLHPEELFEPAGAEEVLLRIRERDRVDDAPEVPASQFGSKGFAVTTADQPSGGQGVGASADATASSTWWALGTHSGPRATRPKRSTAVSRAFSVAASTRKLDSWSRKSRCRTLTIPAASTSPSALSYSRGYGDAHELRGESHALARSAFDLKCPALGSDSVRDAC
jgi:hypothetical protein